MENPPKSIQDRFLEEVAKLGFRFPIARISKETGYGSPIVSEYLASKKIVSDRFLRTFCKVYALSYDEIAKSSFSQSEGENSPNKDTAVPIQGAPTQKAVNNIHNNADTVEEPDMQYPADEEDDDDIDLNNPQTNTLMLKRLFNMIDASSYAKRKRADAELADANARQKEAETELSLARSLERLIERTNLEGGGSKKAIAG